MISIDVSKATAILVMSLRSDVTTTSRRASSAPTTTAASITSDVRHDRTLGPLFAAHFVEVFDAAALQEPGQLRLWPTPPRLSKYACWDRRTDAALECSPMKRPHLRADSVCSYQRPGVVGDPTHGSARSASGVDQAVEEGVSGRQLLGRQFSVVGLHSRTASRPASIASSLPAAWLSHADTLTQPHSATPATSSAIVSSSAMDIFRTVMPATVVPHSYQIKGTSRTRRSGAAGDGALRLRRRPALRQGASDHARLLATVNLNIERHAPRCRPARRAR